MGEGNRIVSLLIGLFVVIVIFTVIASRIRLENGLLGLGGQATPTPTITPTKTPVADAGKTAQEKGTQKTQTDSTDSGITSYTPVTEIPATGASAAVIPLAALSLAAGAYLRRKSKAS